MNKSLETVLKALEQDALAFCSESDWAIVVAECERAGNVRRVSKSAQVILEKAMSRSEAGRFAAQQRWKNHTAQGDGSGGRIPNPPGSSVRGTRSTFKSPQDKTRAEKIMRDALRDNGLDPKSIDSMLNGTGTNADKRLARTLLGSRGFTPGQIREFVGRDTVETSSSEVPEGFPPSTVTADSPKDIRAGLTPRTPNRGSGSFDDGTPFTGKFSSPTDLPKYKAELKAAALYQIHGEITKMHRDAGKKIPMSAKPYMDALNSLSSVNDMYGMDSGKSIVAYAMSNIKFFGDMGKAIKAELSARLK